MTSAAPVAPEAGTPAADGQQLTIEYDITHLDGEPGIRLAARQAATVHDVLTWLHDQQPPDGDPGRPQGSP